MALHYAVSINGTCVGQQVQNTLYFGRADSGDVEEGQQATDELSAAVEAQILPLLTSCLPGHYSLESLSIKIVNSINEPVGAFPVEYPLNGTGTRGGTIDGAGRCAILSLKCYGFGAGQPTRIPKRSYLAIGPITSEDIGIDSSLSSAMGDAIFALGVGIVDFSAVVGTGAAEVISTRVGVENKDGIGAEGTVAMAIVRPFVKNRSSRTPSAKGN